MAADRGRGREPTVHGIHQPCASLGPAALAIAWEGGRGGGEKTRKRAGTGDTKKKGGRRGRKKQKQQPPTSPLPKNKKKKKAKRKQNRRGLMGHGMTSARSKSSPKARRVESSPVRTGSFAIDKPALHGSNMAGPRKTSRAIFAFAGLNTLCKNHDTHTPTHTHTHTLQHTTLPSTPPPKIA